LFTSFASISDFELPNFINNKDKVNLNYCDKENKIITKIHLIRGVMSDRIILCDENENIQKIERSFTL